MTALHDLKLETYHDGMSVADPTILRTLFKQARELAVETSRGGPFAQEAFIHLLTIEQVVDQAISPGLTRTKWVLSPVLKLHAREVYDVAREIVDLESLSGSGPTSGSYSHNVLASFADLASFIWSTYGKGQWGPLDPAIAEARDNRRKEEVKESETCPDPYRRTWCIVNMVRRESSVQTGIVVCWTSG